MFGNDHDFLHDISGGKLQQEKKFWQVILAYEPLAQTGLELLF